MQSASDVSHLNDWKWSWIPVLTTPALLIASGIGFLIFLFSDERNQMKDEIMIWSYVIFLSLSLIIALSLFLNRLDHLAVIVTAVLSSRIAFLLGSYEICCYENPFRWMGTALVLWALIAILLNFSPGVIRTSRNAFLCSSSSKYRREKVGLLLGALIGAFPAFQFTIIIIEQMSISDKTYDFLMFDIWGFYLPIVFAVFIAVSRGINRPISEDVLGWETWLKIIVVTYVLSILGFFLSLNAVHTHNSFL